MSIDAIVPLLERVIESDKASARCGTFSSHRHAVELHALGLKHEFRLDESRYIQVCLSVAVTTVIS